MTVPRRILACATLMITRRCLNRMFLLRPSKLTNELLSYILAVAAMRNGIQLHAYCVLSNHLHIVLTDVERKLPAFEQYLDSLVARAINLLHGRADHFWSCGSYSAVTLVGPEDVLDKAAYVLANPVQAALVPTGSDWPGLWSAPQRIGGRPLVIQRPKFFFGENSSLPASAELRLVCPAGFESAEAFRAMLVEAVKAREERATLKILAEGRSFLGAWKVLTQRYDARPTRGEPGRTLNPRLACKDEWKRIEAIQCLKAFLCAHREAWQAFARGVRETVFPHGTYWMRVMLNVSCAPA